VSPHPLARHANYLGASRFLANESFSHAMFVASRQKEVTRHRKTSSRQFYDCGGEKPLLLKFVESECRSDVVHSKKSRSSEVAFAAPGLYPPPGTLPD
jgi:hypothetical protein